MFWVGGGRGHGAFLPPSMERRFKDYKPAKYFLIISCGTFWFPKLYSKWRSIEENEAMLAETETETERERRLVGHVLKYLPLWLSQNFTWKRGWNHLIWILWPIKTGFGKVKGQCHHSILYCIICRQPEPVIINYRYYKFRN